MKKEKIYKVESIAGHLTHEQQVYSDVTITWCVVRSEPSVSRNKNSLNYEIPKREEFFEPFTHLQSQMFQAYLTIVHGDLSIVKEVQTIEEITPLGSIPHLFKIYQEPEYNLTFKVVGYYWIKHEDNPLF